MADAKQGGSAAEVGRTEIARSEAGAGGLVQQAQVVISQVQQKVMAMPSAAADVDVWIAAVSGGWVCGVDVVLAEAGLADVLYSGLGIEGCAARCRRSWRRRRFRSM